MLLFDWKTIFETSNGDASTIILIIKMMSEGLIPKNKYDPIYKYYGKSFKGSSFLVHTDVLLYNRFRYTDREIAQYLALASTRSLSEYYISGRVILPRLRIPVDLELIKDNRLLHIDEKGDLHFLYEEAPQEKH